MKWRVVFSIAQKDIVDAVKNMYILFSLIMPVGMALLLGFLMPSQQDIQNMPVVVYDPEGSRLVANLQKLSNVNIIRVDSAGQVVTQVEQNGVGGFIVPAGFDAAVDAGQQPELTIYLNNKRGGGMTSTFQSLLYDQVWRMTGDLPAKLNYYGMSTMAGGSDAQQGSVNLDQYLLGMFLVIGLAMAGVFVVPTLIVEEKEKHTLEALLVSPASTAEVVAGKMLVGLFYCLLESGVLILLSKGWAGNWPYTLIALLLGSLFVVALGLFLGSLFRTTHQVNTWSSILMLVLMMPSWLTILGLPSILATIFHLIPTYYMAAVINLSFAGQATLANVWSHLAILVACTVAAFALVTWTLKKEAARA